MGRRAFAPWGRGGLRALGNGRQCLGTDEIEVRSASPRGMWLGKGKSGDPKVQV